jgi:hypothetical protein
VHGDGEDRVNARQTLARRPGPSAIANAENFHNFFTTASLLRPMLAGIETGEASCAPTEPVR